MFDRKEYWKKWYLRNRKKKLKQNIEWNKDNPERTKEITAKYYLKNKDKIAKNHRLYMKYKCKKDLKFNLNHRISKEIYVSLKGNKSGKHWEDLVGYTVNDLMKYLKKTIPKGYNWIDYLKGKLHIDHIIPIRAFIFARPEDEEFKQCWNLYNLRLLEAKENILKKDSITNPILLGLLRKAAI